MPNNSLEVVRNDTAGGRPTFPCRLVRFELFQIDEISKALTERTRAK